jgi:hypothetical protein
MKPGLFVARSKAIAARLLDERDHGDVRHQLHIGTGDYREPCNTRKRVNQRLVSPECLSQSRIRSLPFGCGWAEFRQHCIARHGLDETDLEARMFLDLEAWTLTLLK